MSDDPQSRIRRVLLEDWDPTNASRSPAASGEYDADIPPLLELIAANASEDAIVEYLSQRERDIMCFPGLGRQRLYRVARKLKSVTQASRT